MAMIVRGTKARMKHLLQLATSSGAMLASCGCSSIAVHTGGGVSDVPVFQGAYYDLRLVGQPTTASGFLPPAVSVIYGSLDLFPSAALDTLLLPIDLTFQR